MSAFDTFQSTQAERCDPWLHHLLTQTEWSAMAETLAGKAVRLLALWAEADQVHALLLDEVEEAAAVVSCPVESGGYPSVSAAWPGAILFERMVADLWGHRALGGGDDRPWLDHGHWPMSHPLADRPGMAVAKAEPPEFRLDVGYGEFQLPVGPVRELIEDADHLRLTLRADRIVQAECRLGYTHKGTQSLMLGKSPRTAARFASRLVGDATVAHSIAFAEAAEAALRVEVPPRARILRVIMAEIERIAGHLLALGTTAGLVGVSAIERRCARLRDVLATTSERAFGHRLMMDCVVPGGVAIDIAAEAPEVLREMLDIIDAALPNLGQGHSHSAFAARLSGVGVVDPTLAARLAVGGIVGRSAGVPFDVRRLSSMYRGILGEVPLATTGDALARCRLRRTEIAESARMLAALIEALPDGPFAAAMPMDSGEGVGNAESARGDVWCWLRLDHGQIVGVFPRDPGWALWKLAETTLVGASIDDAPLIRHSLGLSASGMDL